MCVYMCIYMRVCVGVCKGKTMMLTKHRGGRGRGGSRKKFAINFPGGEAWYLCLWTGDVRKKGRVLKIMYTIETARSNRTNECVTQVNGSYTYTIQRHE